MPKRKTQIFAAHLCLIMTALLFAWPSPAKGTEQVVPDAPAESTVPAQDASAPGTAAQPKAEVPTRVPDAFPTLKEYLSDIPADIVGGTKTVFTRENVPLALIGTGATLVA